MYTIFQALGCPKEDGSIARTCKLLEKLNLSGNNMHDIPVHIGDKGRFPSLALVLISENKIQWMNNSALFRFFSGITVEEQIQNSKLRR